MGFELDEYVMYGSCGICLYKGIEERCFDGKAIHEYIILAPLGNERSLYYVPQDMADVKIRKLMSAEKIYSLIDEIPCIEPCSCGDKNERKAFFSSVLKSDDAERIIALIKSLYLKQQDRSRSGKRLSGSEEAAMKSAERMIYQEIGLVLGIEPDKVKDFIAERIEGLPQTSQGLCP